jgi:hypothetical protein
MEWVENGLIKPFMKGQVALNQQFHVANEFRGFPAISA